MNILANLFSRIEQEIKGTGATLQLEKNQVRLTGPAGSSCLRIIEIYRPSAEEIERSSAPDALLVLTAPTQKAAKYAAPHNHILLPSGGYRIVLPGIALIHEAPLIPAKPARQARLMGRTGVVAESALLGGEKEWSIRDLAADANVSPALVHRVVTRLENENLFIRKGRGPKTTRALTNFTKLAELWGEEEKTPEPSLRGFLYGASTELIAQKILKASPGSAIGGVLAANLYCPVLTRINSPLRIWMPWDFNPDALEATGFEKTDSGANIEIFQTEGDPWRVHAAGGDLPKVSRWRAWLEIANAEGRTQELAETLLSELERR